MERLRLGAFFFLLLSSSSLASRLYLDRSASSSSSSWTGTPQQTQALLSASLQFLFILVLTLCSFPDFESGTNLMRPHNGMAENCCFKPNLQPPSLLFSEVNEHTDTFLPFTLNEFSLSESVSKAQLCRDRSHMQSLVAAV